MTVGAKDLSELRFLGSVRPDVSNRFMLDTSQGLVITGKTVFMTEP